MSQIFSDYRIGESRMIALFIVTYDPKPLGKYSPILGFMFITSYNQIRKTYPQLLPQLKHNGEFQSRYLIAWFLDKGCEKQKRL